MMKVAFVLSLVFLVFGAEAKIEMGAPFADGMVLQRGMKVPVWGRVVPDAEDLAKPSEGGPKVALPGKRKITVSFAGQEKTVESDAVSGRWKVELDPMEASREGRTLTVTEKKRGFVFDSTVSSLEIKDVLVGEVWYCAGQSNAEMPLVGDNPHFSDRLGRLTAQMTVKPNVRFCYASNYKWSTEPKAKAAYKVEWKRFTPANLMTPPSFSAMGCYFALELYSAIDVPIGIVGSYWGGTGVDPWTPRCGYEGKDELREVAAYEVHDAKSWKDEHKKGPISDACQQPTVLWNEMVAPWCPMAMRGFVWYQGCHNRTDGALYRAKMHALYDGWAKEFANPGLKLYFVQLAPFSCSWYDVQLAQAKFAFEQPNAGMVTTCDIGNNDDVHPIEKGTIGKRLAALALSRDYGFADINAEVPTLKSCKWENDRVVLSFNHADGWYLYNPDWATEVPFEVAGEDGKWVPARVVNSNLGKTKPELWVTRGQVEGKDLVVAADGVKPVKVRYLYQKPWNGNLYAANGIPLGPFEAAK